MDGNLYDQRTAIERPFTAWGTCPQGLNELPKHTRRLHRVRRLVQLSLHLNATRILMTSQRLTRPRR